MHLKEFFEKYKMNKTKFAGNVDLNLGTLYGYLSGRWKPSQDAAERIEKYTDGLVTVQELRGKDDRNKKRSANSDTSQQDVRGEDSASPIPSN